MRQGSVDFLSSTSQKSSTKPAIAQASSKQSAELIDPVINPFVNKVEFVTATGANRKRKKPVPQRKLGYQTSENDSRLSPDLSEEINSRGKTDSGSSHAEDRVSSNGLSSFQRAAGGHRQNFSYSNFYSFGAQSPHQSENYPPVRLQHQNSVLSSQNAIVLSPFEQ